MMRISIKKILLSLLAVAGICRYGYCKVSATLPDEHKSLTIYEIMVASFQHHPDGAPGYNAMWGPDGETKNGNLRGITEALPHIKALGANAIWLTPIFDSSKADLDWSGGEKLQSTGYYTNNYFAIDPKFGTEQDFRQLVKRAHELDMYVFLDGVFGHHGGSTAPSPQGNMIDTTYTENVRGFGGGNVKYPESLPYFKEVATYWIENFDIDGWRMDQAYQLVQNGHNYWAEIREAVEDTCAKRKAQGKKWGTLGYIVCEDFGTTDEINHGVYSNLGVLSAFDFDGKERISGKMQKLGDEGLANGWDDIITVYSSPSKRGYLTDSVMPNLYVTNHDGYRLADHFSVDDPYYIEKQMTRMAILAGYNGPVTLYYGDEFGDRSAETKGGQPDNISRTSGHITPRNEKERELYEYTANVLNIRRNNPAMWRGNTTFEKANVADAKCLIIRKEDPQTGNKVLLVFSDADTTVPIHGYGPVDVDAWRPEVIVVAEPK